MFDFILHEQRNNECLLNVMTKTLVPAVKFKSVSIACLKYHVKIVISEIRSEMLCMETQRLTSELFTLFVPGRYSASKNIFGSDGKHSQIRVSNGSSCLAIKMGSKTDNS